MCLAKRMDATGAARVARGLCASGVGEFYNVGGEDEAIGREHLGDPESLMKFVKKRSGHDQRYVLDSSKIRALGQQPQRNFNSAMRRTVEG